MTPSASPKALTEETDIPNPREHMAITRIQAAKGGVNLETKMDSLPNPVPHSSKGVANSPKMFDGS